MTDTENFLAKNCCKAHSNRTALVFHSHSAVYLQEPNRRRDLQGQCCISIFVLAEESSGWRRPGEVSRPTSRSGQGQISGQSRLLRPLANLLLKTLKKGDFPLFLYGLDQHFNYNEIVICIKKETQEKSGWSPQSSTDCDLISVQ